MATAGAILVQALDLKLGILFHHLSVLDSEIMMWYHVNSHRDSTTSATTAAAAMAIGLRDAREKRPMRRLRMMPQQTKRLRPRKRDQ